MILFRKSNVKMIVLKTTQQRDEFIERLDKAHVEYDVSEKRDDVYSRDIFYIIHVNAEDYKKVG